MSLRLRITVLFLLAQLSLLVAFSTGTFLFTYRRLIKSFDQSLIANSEALASLVKDHINDENSNGFAFSYEVMPRFSRRKEPDLFAILLPDGRLLQKSKSMPYLPDFIIYTKDRRFQNFHLDEEHYRGVFFPVTHEISPQETSSDKERQFTIFFATNREDLDDDLADILEFIIGSAILMAFLSTGVAFWVARKSLKPLYHLADEASNIDAENLDFRFVLGTLPTDIQALGSAFNDVLFRIEEGFKREQNFTDDAAHELRTPVTIIKSTIQSALLFPPDQQQDRKTLEELNEDVNRLEELIEALLLSIRTSSEENEGAVMPVQEFCSEIEEVISTFPLTVDKSGTSIHFQGPDSTSGYVYTNNLSLRQIMTNLISNAVRHGGKTTNVYLSISQSEDKLSVMVEDDGPGVPAELKQQLFQRFVRGDKSRTRSTGGLGLGLSISRISAEQCGGTLSYQDREGGGSCFIWESKYRNESQ